jgi:hypothetical protein
MAVLAACEKPILDDVTEVGASPAQTEIRTVASDGVYEIYTLPHTETVLKVPKVRRQQNIRRE